MARCREITPDCLDSSAIKEAKRKVSTDFDYCSTLPQRMEGRVGKFLHRKSRCRVYLAGTIKSMLLKGWICECSAVWYTPSLPVLWNHRFSGKFQFNP